MPLSVVKLLLCEDKLSVVVISVEQEGYSIKVVVPNLESKDHRCQLQIMNQIILLLDFKLSGLVCYHFALLHQDTAKFDIRSIVHHKVIIALSETQEMLYDSQRGIEGI